MYETRMIDTDRVAVVFGHDVDRAAAYLPRNYRYLPIGDTGSIGLVFGADDAGWTLNGYVLPRLATGLISGFEIAEVADDDNARALSRLADVGPGLAYVVARYGIDRTAADRAYATAADTAADEKHAADVRTKAAWLESLAAAGFEETTGGCECGRPLGHD